MGVSQCFCHDLTEILSAKELNGPHVEENKLETTFGYCSSSTTSRMVQSIGKKGQKQVVRTGKRKMKRRIS